MCSTRWHLFCGTLARCSLRASSPIWASEKYTRERHARGDATAGGGKEKGRNSCTFKRLRSSSLKSTTFSLSVPEMENSVFLDLALFRFTLVSSPSFSCSSRRSTAISWSATLPCTCFLIFLLSGLRSGEETDLGRQRLNLSSLESLFSLSELIKALKTKENNWWRFLIFLPQELHTRSDLSSQYFTGKPTLSHSFARITPNEPFCFEGWNKFSVPIWRAWDPNLTLNEQPHRRQLSLTEGESDLLPLPVFFFGVSSAIADITRVFGEKSIVFLHFPRKFRAGQLGLLSINFNFRKVIFQPMVFPFVWAKYKWKFVRDGCKLSFRRPLAASPLARAFSLGSLRSPRKQVGELARRLDPMQREWIRSFADKQLKFMLS